MTFGFPSYNHLLMHCVVIAAALLFTVRSQSKSGGAYMVYNVHESRRSAFTYQWLYVPLHREEKHSVSQKNENIAVVSWKRAEL